MDVVADIGGTNTRIAFLHNGAISGLLINPTESFANPFEALTQYVIEHRIVPQRAFLSVAGPVFHDEVKIVNASWRPFSISGLKQSLKLEKLVVINDCQAAAAALPYLQTDEFDIKHGAVSERNDTKALLSCGTGLGAAFLFFTPNGWMPVATELGHIIKQEGCATTFEDMASGRALPELFRQAAKLTAPQAQQTAEQIVNLANQGNSLAQQVCGAFSTALGQFAQTIALGCQPFGGIFIDSQVVHKMGAAFDWDAFRQAYLVHPNMAHILAATPVAHIKVVPDKLLTLEGLRRLALASPSKL